jgi:hypothetical protein
MNEILKIGIIYVAVYWRDQPPPSREINRVVHTAGHDAGNVMLVLVLLVVG